MQSESADRSNKPNPELRGLLRERQFGSRHTYRKDDVVFRMGDSDRSLYLIDNGLLAARYLTPNGKQFTKSFFVEGDIVGNIAAAISGGPNTFSLVCLENCSLFRIEFGDLEALCEKDSAASAAIIRVLMELVAKKERREYEFLCLTAEERYLLLLESRPDLVERIRMKDLASYLGITAVALSRIRARINLEDTPSLPSSNG